MRSARTGILVRNSGKARKQRPPKGPEALYIERQAPSSQGTQRAALRTMKKIITPATVNRYLAALRGVAREAWRLHMISMDDLERIRSIENVRGRGPMKGRALPRAEILKLFATVADDPSPLAARDGAVLAVLYAGGLRRAEAAALRADQVDLERGRMELHETKGHAARAAFVGEGLGFLRRWAAIRPADLDAASPFLLAVSSHGSVLHKGISGHTIARVVDRRAAQAGIAPTSPHDLRRSHATDLLAAGVDALLVGKHLGHAKVETVLRYDRRPEDAVRKAAEALGGFGIVVPGNDNHLEPTTECPAPADIPAAVSKQDQEKTDDMPMR